MMKSIKTLKNFTKQIQFLQAQKGASFNNGVSFLNMHQKVQFNFSSQNTEEFINKIRERKSFEEPYIPTEEYKGLQQMQKDIKENVYYGRLKDAEEVSKIYVDKIEKFYGNTHPAFFSAMNNLGLVYKMRGDYTNSKEIYENVLIGYKELFGQSHNSTQTIMLNLANLYIQQGMFHKALDYLNLVLSYRVGEHFMELRGEDNMEYDENNQIKFENYHLDEIEQIKNNKIPLCLIPMSKCYRELKEYEKSIKLSKRALELLRTFYKENNVLIATVHNNMGLTYKVMKGYNKAEESYLKALEIRKSILNEEHPDIIATKHNLGELYLAMDQPEKAQEYLFSNVDTMKKQLSKEQQSQQ